MTEHLTWAEYREVHKVTDADDAQAFANYVRYVSSGRWTLPTEGDHTDGLGDDLSPVDRAGRRTTH